mgnify:CR=1 FL=1
MPLSAGLPCLHGRLSSNVRPHETTVRASAVHVADGHRKRKHMPKVVAEMCRNIRTLFNFEPPASELEIRDASLQFVRKLSGFNVPSKANEAAFERAVEQVAAAARELIAGLVTNAPPKNREVEAQRAREKSALRYAR